MTSRNSSSAEVFGPKDRGFLTRQLRLMRRRVAILALIVLYSFIFYPVGAAVAIARSRTLTYYAGGEGMDAAAASTLISRLFGLRSFGFVATLIIALILGIQGFAYLNDKRQIDLYASLPEKRSVRFADIAVNSFLMYALPTLLCLICGLSVAQGLAGITAGVVGECALAYLRGCLLFLAVYGIAALSMTLSGNTLVSILLSGLALSGEWLVAVLIRSYMREFFVTYYDRGYEPWLSVVYNHAKLMNEASRILGSFVAYKKSIWDLYGSIFAATWSRDLVTLIVAVLSLLAAYRLFLGRRAEDAGKTLIHRPTRLIVKIWGAILSGGAAGLFIIQIFDNHHTPSVLIFAGFGVFCAACFAAVLTEVVYALDVKAVFTNRLINLGCGVLAALLFVVYARDLTGFDRYLPRESEIESGALICNDQNGGTLDDLGRWSSPDEFRAQHMFLTDTRSLTRLGAAGQQFTRDFANTMNRVDTLSEEETSQLPGYYDIVLCYRLRGGREVYRAYKIPSDIDAELMDRLVGSAEYRAGAGRIGNEDALLEFSNIDNISCDISYDMGSISSRNRSYEDLAAAFERFRTAYLADYAQYNYSMASKTPVIAMVNVELIPKEGAYYRWSLSYPIYPGYTRAIAVLKELGIYVDPVLTPEDVRSIAVEDMHYELWGDEGYTEEYRTEATYEDPQQIAEILESIEPTCFFNFWFTPGRYEDNIQLSLRLTDEKYYDIYYYSFLKDRVPDFVREDMEAQ